MTEELQCAHHEAMSRDNVGTCRYCAQVKQYPGWRGGPARILKKGDPAKANVEGFMKALRNQIPVPEEKRPEKVVMSPTSEEYKNMMERHKYFEQHKAEICECLLTKGQVATIKEWGINGSSLKTLMKRWLKPAEMDKVKALGVGRGKGKRGPYKKRTQQTPKPEPAKTEAPVEPKVVSPVDLVRLAEVFKQAQAKLESMEDISSRAVAGAIVNLQEVAKDILQYNAALKQSPQPQPTLLPTRKLGYIVNSLDNLLEYMD